MAAFATTYKAFPGRLGVAAQRGTMRGLASKRRVAFHGRCYYCDYHSHSQMFCPKRWCRVCKEYGHSEAVCRRGGGGESGAGGDDDAGVEWD